jgi:SOS-response transcriptional repressor LexA
MDRPERIAKVWLRFVNSKWLNHFSGSALSDPASQVLNKLRNARKNSETKQTWDFINHLQRLSETVEGREKAEILLWCGLMAAEMDDFREALKYFMDSSRIYANSNHHRAVAEWMEGCIHWLLPHQEVNAMSKWRSSIKKFESLRDHCKQNHEDYHWYKERCIEMSDALHRAVDEYKIPPLPDGADEWTDEPGVEETPSQNDNPVSRLHTPNNHDDPAIWFQFIPVYDHISAGKFDASNILEQPVTHMEVDRVIIEGVPYRIHSFTGSRLVNLPSLQEHYVLKVTGNSMNRAKPVPIDPNDYVLMKRQSVAPSGNIVAAVIIRDDPLATLKRFYQRGDEYILQPESDDPKWQERILMKEDFSICGIVLAVLKKIQD